MLPRFGKGELFREKLTPTWSRTPVDIGGRALFTCPLFIKGEDFREMASRERHQPALVKVREFGRRRFRLASQPCFVTT